MARPKRPTDFNERALQIVREATGEEPKQEYDPETAEKGRKGGQKGGKARAEALTAEERREIARKAAEARWSKADN